MVIAIRPVRLILRFLILSRFDSNCFLNTQVQKLLTIMIRVGKDFQRSSGIRMGLDISKTGRVSNIFVLERWLISLRSFSLQLAPEIISKRNRIIVQLRS